MIKNLLGKMRSAYPQGGAASASRGRGFTLLELLIVIALLAILAVVVILVLNPAETLRRARDSQRISDMSSLKSAIGLYLTDVVSPDLDTAISADCQSPATANVTIVYGGDPDGSSDATDITTQTANATETATGIAAHTTGVPTADREAVLTVAGLGWLPVNFGSITGGSPLGNLPLDPNFSVGVAADVLDGTDAGGDRLYIYGCDDSVFEINTNLEAVANTGTGNREEQDGGDNLEVYEVGTDLSVISTW